MTAPSWQTAGRLAQLATWICAIAATACGDDDGTVVIGLGYLPGELENVQLMEAELASQPEDGGQRISVVFDVIDGSNTPLDVQVHKAQRWAQTPGLVAVVGHPGSRGSLAAAPVYNAAEIVQIAPTSTSRLLRDAGPWTFALPPNDSVEGAFIARFATERLDARRATLFYVNDEYGAGLRDGIRAELDMAGVAVLEEIPVDPSSDVSVLIEAAFARGVPDLIISGARSVTTARLVRFGQQLVPGMRVVAGDGASNVERLKEHAGPAIDSIYEVAFWLPDVRDPRSQKYVERFRAVTGGRPSSSEAMAYDAFGVLVAAIRTVGDDPAAIRQYLLELGQERPPYPGVTGPIGFAPERRPNLIMARIRNGRWVRVES